MAHKFNPKNLAKLDSPLRRELLPPFRVLKNIGLKPKTTMVDLGCAIGYFTIPAAKIIGSEGKVYGIDILPELLKEAQNRLEEYRSQSKEVLAPVEFLQSQENNIPISDSSIDMVFMANVFHELESSQDLLSDIRRILKDSGKIALVEWKKEEMEWGPPLEERLEPSQVQHELEKAGFIEITLIEVEPAHYGIVAVVSKFNN